MKTATLTNEAKRVLIAASLGLDPWWKCETHSAVDGPNCRWCNGPVVLHGDEGPVGDYFTDLNAAITLCDALATEFDIIIRRHNGSHWKVEFCEPSREYTATAEILPVAICEAYAKARGLW